MSKEDNNDLFVIQAEEINKTYRDLMLKDPLDFSITDIQMLKSVALCFKKRLVRTEKHIDETQSLSKERLISILNGGV